MLANRISDYHSYKISDFDVVKRVLGGEKELYEILIRRYNQLLYRVVRSYLNDESEVDDLMQEIWLKVWENLYRYRGDATFSTWLVRVGINEALMNNREKKNRARFPANRNSTHEQLVRIPDPENRNPEMKTMQWENRRMLEQAIERLPELYKTVYMLREVEGMNAAETARCLKISDNNVKVRLHRARAILKDELLRLTGDIEAFEFGNRRCDRVVEKVMNFIF